VNSCSGRASGSPRVESVTLSSTANEGIITKVIAEIKYARGMVYLDRCGSLALQMQDLVGPNFRVSVPDMESAQLENGLERIVLTFGRNAFRVEQTGPATVARMEKLTTDGWECVAEALGVRGAATRFAVRIFNVWPTPSLAAAREALGTSGLVRASLNWETMLGSPSWSAFVANFLTERGRIRRCLDEVETVVDGLLPEGFAPFFPAFGVQYDVDFVYRRTNEPFSLKREQTREFVRSSWNTFQVDRAKLVAAFARSTELQ
jgi:hypothetical protein